MFEEGSLVLEIRVCAREGRTGYGCVEVAVCAGRVCWQPKPRVSHSYSEMECVLHIAEVKLVRCECFWFKQKVGSRVLLDFNKVLGVLPDPSNSSLINTDD